MSYIFFDCRALYWDLFIVVLSLPIDLVLA